MRVLVIGSGGREHAIAWRLSRDGHELHCAPGNPGMAQVGTCHSVAVSDIAALVELGKREAVELVVVGPEVPLCDGLADALRAGGIPTFGPGREAAALEGSKFVCKRFFRRHGIRTADFRECASMADVDAALEALGDRVVVKADGLAAGKGVVVCKSRGQAREAAREMLEDGRFGDAGKQVLIETRLEGRELSVMALCDGKRYAILAQAEDHKAVRDGDEGPNTGGMGTVSPAPWASAELLERVRRDVFDRTLEGLAKDGLDFRGVLYAGLMVDAKGAPWILEYNVRFGDPETQPVFMRWQGDVGAWLLGAATGELPPGEPAWDERTAVCVVMAADGYPESPKKGDPITGLESVADASIFHAGTSDRAQGLVTSGGRVLSVCALGADVHESRQRAYRAIEQITFDGAHYRRDIGIRREETP